MKAFLKKGDRRMMIDCPKCHNTRRIESYELSDKACDDTEIECQCGYKFNVGWYPVAELR